MDENTKAKAIEHLSCPFFYIELQCGADVVTLRNAQEKPMRFCVVPFINGYFNGEWFDLKNPAPETRYYRTVRKYIYRGKEREKQRKIDKRLKRKPEECWADKYIEYVYPSFPNAKMAINHILKVCPEAILIYPKISEE